MASYSLFNASALHLLLCHKYYYIAIAPEIIQVAQSYVNSSIEPFLVGLVQTDTGGLCGGCAVMDTNNYYYDQGFLIINNAGHQDKGCWETYPTM